MPVDSIFFSIPFGVILSLSKVMSERKSKKNKAILRCWYELCGSCTQPFNETILESAMEILLCCMKSPMDFISKYLSNFGKFAIYHNQYCIHLNHIIIICELSQSRVEEQKWQRVDGSLVMFLLTLIVPGCHLLKFTWSFNVSVSNLWPV